MASRYEVHIGGGDSNGGIGPVPPAESGIYWYVPTGTTITVLTNRQYLVRGPLVLEGTAMIQLQGTAKLVIL